MALGNDAPDPSLITMLVDRGWTGVPSAHVEQRLRHHRFVRDTVASRGVYEGIVARGHGMEGQ
jgi:hypothetical protein